VNHARFDSIHDDGCIGAIRGCYHEAESGAAIRRVDGEPFLRFDVVTLGALSRNVLRRD